MSRFKSTLLRAGLLASLLSFGTGAAFAEAPNADIRTGMQTPPPADQRVALVIGNSNYQTAPKLANPGNDAQSMSQLLNSAGFEVTQATDLTRKDMVRVVQDFTAKVAERGPGTVAMIYYAGHGVQVEGENYLLPVDAKISSSYDLDGNSLRLVDLMGTLDAISSRMRIVVLDACRNNPFPEVNDAGRGLAIVDAPNGSIVGYSTAPGMEAADGDGNHSPYTSAFLNIAREPNLPIEQLFKRVRLEVNHATRGRQTPWESSSLTSDFYFFGDTAVAAGREPDRRPILQMAANLPSRSVRQAYDYVVSEGSPEYYEEFIRLYPNDPLCDDIRVLHYNLKVAKAWHKAVLANSPFAYKTFHENYSNSLYAPAALKLYGAPKAVPLMQFTHLAKQSPSYKHGNFGPSFAHNKSGGGAGPFQHMPVTAHRSRSATATWARWARCPARTGTAPSMPATAAATPASSRECRAGSTTIRCEPATGTCSATARVISAAGWAADASASASPRARRACRSPAVRSVAAGRLAADVRSGGFGRRH